MLKSRTCRTTFLQSWKSSNISTTRFCMQNWTPNQTTAATVDMKEKSRLSKKTESWHGSARNADVLTSTKCMSAEEHVVRIVNLARIATYQINRNSRDVHCTPNSQDYLEPRFSTNQKQKGIMIWFADNQSSTCLQRQNRWFCHERQKNILCMRTMWKIIVSKNQKPWTHLVLQTLQPDETIWSLSGQ